jgi:hypothetical protein
METTPHSARVRFTVLGVFALVLTSLTTFTYFFLKNFIEDREEILTQADFELHSPKTNTIPMNRSEVKTYTAEELETLRKQGKSPEGMSQTFNQNQAIQANEAAVQRSLKTLEEINRINQMNQQLIEQQQRMNRQR